MTLQQFLRDSLDRKVRTRHFVIKQADDDSVLVSFNNGPSFIVIDNMLEPFDDSAGVDPDVYKERVTQFQQLADAVHANVTITGDEVDLKKPAVKEQMGHNFGISRWKRKK